MNSSFHSSSFASYFLPSKLVAILPLIHQMAPEKKNFPSSTASKIYFSPRFPADIKQAPNEFVDHGVLIPTSSSSALSPLFKSYSARDFPTTTLFMKVKP